MFKIRIRTTLPLPISLKKDSSGNHYAPSHPNIVLYVEKGIHSEGMKWNFRNGNWFSLSHSNIDITDTHNYLFYPEIKEFINIKSK